MFIQSSMAALLALSMTAMAPNASHQVSPLQVAQEAPSFEVFDVTFATPFFISVGADQLRVDRGIMVEIHIPDLNPTASGYEVRFAGAETTRVQVPEAGRGEAWFFGEDAAALRRGLKDGPSQLTFVTPDGDLEILGSPKLRALIR